MLKNKIQSFTLPELLVVMIITAIVVGLAFSVLRLVQNQIHAIEANYNKTATLALFKQQLWQDFNEMSTISTDEFKNQIILQSHIDSVYYFFDSNYILRNNDTIKLKLTNPILYYQGKEVKKGIIDAISISANTELADYKIFVSKKNDLVHSINQEDGF